MKAVGGAGGQIGEKPGEEDEDDDDVPELVGNFEETAKKD